MSRISKKALSGRIELFLAAWKEYAPNQVFADMTLEQFATKTEQSGVARDLMLEANTKLQGLMLQRDQVERAIKDDMILIAHAIRGTSAYGEDCPFYRSLGFVPKSERKSGLKRNKPSGGAPKVPPSGAVNAA